MWEDFLFCENGGRSESKVDTRFRQGTLSENCLGWKYNDQLGFTCVSLKFKENSRVMTTTEITEGLFLQHYYYRMAGKDDGLLLVLLNGWRISLIYYFYYWVTGEYVWWIIIIECLEKSGMNCLLNACRIRLIFVID